MLGTIGRPIIDCSITDDEAFVGMSTECPESIKSRQICLPLLHYGFDAEIHQGVLIVDRELQKDILEVFRVAKAVKFPIFSVIPLCHPRFRLNNTWDDYKSMEANNTSAFNYRLIAGTNRLSNHAYGRAIDINPVQNPYIRGSLVRPLGAVYNPDVPGTLTSEHPITQTFLQLGWEWGGHWTTRKDYQHFEKPLNIK